MYSDVKFPRKAMGCTNFTFQFHKGVKGPEAPCQNSKFSDFDEIQNIITRH